MWSLNLLHTQILRFCHRGAVTIAIKQRKKGGTGRLSPIAGRWQGTGQAQTATPPTPNDRSGIAVLSVSLRALRGQAWQSLG